MRKFAISIIAAVLLCAMPVFANQDPTGTTTTVTADGVEFEPVPQDLGDLDHSAYYTWGIDWQLPQNEEIASATLSFLNLNNWAQEADDILYVNLLDSAPWGVTLGYDGEASGNAFDGAGWLLFSYTDIDESTPENPDYPFTAGQLGLLANAVSDGNFGLGFDPDCHFNNDGVKLKVATRVIPEPIASQLFLIGAGMVSFFIRKKKRQA